MQKEKVFLMDFKKVYDCLVTKAERKGRTIQEVNEIITWLTGYNENQLFDQLKNNVSYKKFFDEAPHFNENSKLITGSICGVKLSEIDDETMLKIRYLDKLIDELAKGKPMDKILRK